MSSPDGRAETVLAALADAGYHLVKPNPAPNPTETPPQPQWLADRYPGTVWCSECEWWHKPGPHLAKQPFD